MSSSNDVAKMTVPALNPATIVDAAQLGAAIEKFVEADAADYDHREAIEGLRAELRGLATDEARELSVRLDDAVDTRLRDLAVALVQWGFAEGLRYGGGGHRGGAR